MAVKEINLKDVTNVSTIANDGLLLVKYDEPLSHTRECICCP